MRGAHGAHGHVYGQPSLQLQPHVKLRSQSPHKKPAFASASASASHKANGHHGHTQSAYAVAHGHGHGQVHAHGLVLPNREGEKYGCPVRGCKKAYAHKRTLENHILEKHRGAQVNLVSPDQSPDPLFPCPS